MKQKHIALFDLDGTLYKGAILFDLSHYFEKVGIFSLDRKEIILNDFQKYKEKRQDYTTTVVNVLNNFAHGLKGQNLDDVMQKSRSFIHAKSENFFNYVPQLFSELVRTHDVFLVSAAPDFACKPVAEFFGIQGYLSSKYSVQDGVFTGEVNAYLSASHQKKAVITPILQKYGLPNSIAVGDSIGDIDMIESVAISVCINPSPELLRVAKTKNWIITSPEEITKTLLERIVI
jgi:HAD superfamily hydrolase (TIGR01490 family)